MTFRFAYSGQPPLSRYLVDDHRAGSSVLPQAHPRGRRGLGGRGGFVPGEAVLLGGGGLAARGAFPGGAGFSAWP